MRKLGNLVIVFFIVFIQLQMTATVNASPPPEEVEKRKEAAPLQVVGEVRDDELLQDKTVEVGHPNQIRMMELQIEKIIKKPDELDLKTGQSIKIRYDYIPSWVKMDGAAKMDIMVGDKIEIWLLSGEDGWQPAFSGNTVNHMEYVNNRKEPIPEPFIHWLTRYSRDHTEIVVFSGLVVLLGLAMVISRKINVPNKKEI